MIIAFDPGAKRTGIAVRDLDDSRYCFSREPWLAVLWLDSQPAISVGLVILEQWTPNPNKQAGNAWRDLVEVKTLGALEWICRSKQIEYIYQPTGILKPIFAMADARGHKWRATNRDEKAAEAHLLHWEYQQTQEET